MKEFCLSCGGNFEFKDRKGMTKYIPKICSSNCFMELLERNKEKSGLSEFTGKILTPYSPDFRDKVGAFKEQPKHYRSNYETFFSYWLLRNNINWKYEPFIFTLSNKSKYVPDFYLPQYNAFIEIKGLWHGESKRKFKLFVKEFPFQTYLLDWPALQLLNK